MALWPALQTPSSAPLSSSAPKASDPFGFRREARPSPPALYGGWRSCLIGGGGFAQGVVTTGDSNVLYLYVDVGGVYRSDDGGRRWRMLHGAFPADGFQSVRSILADPRDPNRLLVLRGDQWTPPEARDPGPGPDAGKGGAGIYETRDGGRSFRKLQALSAYGNGPDRWTGVLLRRDPGDPRRIYAGSAGEGVLVSEDDGGTWRRVGGEALGGLYATDLVVDASDPRTVWLLARAQEVETYAGRRAFGGGLFRSDDRGRTWARIAAKAPSEMVQDGTGNGRGDGRGRRERLVGIFDETDVRASADGGRTWRPYTEGVTLTKDASREGYTSDARFSALAVGPGFVVLGTNRGGFYRRNANAAAWERIEPRTAAMQYEGRAWFGGARPGGPPRFGAAMGSVTIDPRDARHWWLTDWYAVYESRDAGVNWRLSMDGVETTVIHTFEGDPKTPAIVHLGMADNGYFGSRDGGARFETPLVVSNAKCLTVSYQRPERLVMAGDAGNGEWVSDTLWASVDRGGSWVRLPMTGLPPRGAHHVNTVAFDPRDDRRVYAAVSGPRGGMYVSVDEGLTWTRESDGLPTDDEPRHEGASLFQSDIWVVGREFAANGDGEVVVASKPRGEVYRRETAGYVRLKGIEGQPNEVAAAPNRRGVFLVATDRGVYRSEDGGRTFARTLGRSARHVAIDKTNPRRCAAGVLGGVMLSSDGGLTWREAGRGLPDRNGPVVGFAAGRVLAGTAGSGAFWLPLDSTAYRVEEARPLPERRPVLPPPTPGRGRPVALLAADGGGGFGDAARFGSLWSVGFVARGRLAVDSVVDPVRPAEEAPATFGAPPAAPLAPLGGGRALRLRALTEGAKGAASARLNAPPARFRVTGAARADGRADEALVAVQGFDRAGRQTAFVTLFDARNAARPTRFAGDVELPAGTATANLVVTYEGSGAVLLDDVRFETPGDGLTPDAVPLSTDLLENGGFEDPARALLDWRPVLQRVGGLSVGVASDAPHSGTRALVVRNVPGLAGSGASDDADGAVTARLKRVVRRLRIEGYVRSEGALRSASLLVRGFDPRGQTRLVPVADARGSAAWTPFVAEVEMPDGTTGIELVVTFAGVGSVSLDDLRLTTLVER